jgi:Flp pilus assembly protein TadD
MDPQEMVEKGQDLFSQGFIHEAETVFNHVLANDPNNAAALNNLGVVAFNRGDSAAAERYFKQAIDIQSDYPDALLNLADLCMKTNQWQEAAGHLEQCACRHPAASLFELLAEVHAKLGHLDESEAYLKKSYQCTQEGESALDTSIPKVRICAAQTERCESQLNILFVQDSPCIRNYTIRRLQPCARGGTGFHWPTPASG